MAQVLAIAFGWGIAWVCTIVLTLFFRKYLKIRKMAIWQVLWRTGVLVVVVQLGLMVTLLLRDPNTYQEFQNFPLRRSLQYHAAGVLVALGVIFPAVKLLFGARVKFEDLDHTTKAASALGYCMLAFGISLYTYLILGESLDWWWIEEPAP